MLNGCSGFCIIPASEGEDMRSAEELPSKIGHFDELWVWLRDFASINEIVRETEDDSLTCAHVACTNTNIHMY